MSWVSPENCVGLQATICKQLDEASLNNKLTFPDLRRDTSLVLACDYSGEHQSSKYQLFTFLLADRPSVLNEWEPDRLRIREEFLNDGRRHAFKSLSDSKRQKALFPFLKASSNLNGMLFCVAIDKELQGSTLRFNLEEVPNIKRDVLAKLLKVSFFGSVLISGLCKDGQNLLWITDDDEIVGNDSIATYSANLTESLFNQLCMKELQLSFGIAGKFEDNYRAEDLCSIPDLVGGAICDCLNSIPAGAIPKNSVLVSPMTKRLPTKSSLITSWFADENQKLKTMFCLLRAEAKVGIRVSFGRPNIFLDDEHRSLWIPPDKGWRKSAQSWDLP